MIFVFGIICYKLILDLYKEKFIVVIVIFYMFWEESDVWLVKFFVIVWIELFLILRDDKEIYCIVFKLMFMKVKWFKLKLIMSLFFIYLFNEYLI